MPTRPIRGLAEQYAALEATLSGTPLGRGFLSEYMRRHRVKSGITGWAQVNGWRGNTSIEKRIEHDIYYIENWSLLLDLKILILTLFRGFGQKHAY